MSILTFDTLKYANRLKAANVPPEQAEATVGIMSETFEINLKDLATKEDLHREINDVRKDMKAQEERVAFNMKALEERVTISMQALEERMISKMTLRLGSMLVVTVGLMFTLIKLFGI